MTGDSDPTQPPRTLKLERPRVMNEPSPSASDAAFERVLSQVASVPRLTPLQEGSIVGEYRLVKQLGKGTFGTVYHGAHTVIGKQAALKVLNAEFSDDSPTVSRFIDEARAVNRIAHPNIVDIFGFGELQDGRKYCVMELLEGETLAAFLSAHGRCEWPEAARILTQIAAALDAAHDQHIVHRDLKPDNIFINRKPSAAGESEQTTIKLLDFGIARIAKGSQTGSATESGVVLGTPAYMSPEQCRGAQVDRRTDVYALGVVAFEMLTGKLPFTGQNVLQLVWAHLNDVPPTPTDFNPDLPPAVNTVLAQLLAKAREDRPERASEAVNQLLVALGQPVLSLASTWPLRVVPAGKRGNRWLWAVAAAAATALILLQLRPRSEAQRPSPAASVAASAPPARAAPSAAPAAATSPAAAGAPSASAPAKASATKKPNLVRPKVAHDLEY